MFKHANSGSCGLVDGPLPPKGLRSAPAPLLALQVLRGQQAPWGSAERREQFHWEIRETHPKTQTTGEHSRNLKDKFYILFIHV